MRIKAQKAEKDEKIIPIKMTKPERNKKMKNGIFRLE